MPYYRDIYVEPAENKFDPNKDLLEKVEDLSPGSGSFSLESDESTVLYEIPFAKQRSFLRFMLGFAYIEPGRNPASQNHPPQRLCRENPQFHPMFPWQHAVSVTFQGWSPDGDKGLMAAGPSAKDSWFTRLFSRSNIGYYGRYRRCWATVKFKSMPWAVLDDEDPLRTSELARNTFVDLSPSIESISAEGGTLGQLKWRETSAAAPGPPAVPAGPNLSNPAITSSFNTLVSKNAFLLNLVHFPQEFFSVVNSSTKPFIPTNILKCVGRVNNAEFMGFAPGTLLLQPPKFQRFRWPIFTSPTSLPFFGYNVSLPLVHFDPDKGVPDTPPGTSPYRGYRLMPWAPNLKWYHATRSDDSTHLLAEADFNDIFKIPTQA